MRAAYSIYAQVFKPNQAPFPHFFGHGASQHSGIVVQTHSLDFHILTVKRKAFVGIELECPQTHRAAV